MTTHQPMVRHRTRPAPKVLDAHGPAGHVCDAQQIARLTGLEHSPSSLQAPEDQHRGLEDVGLSKAQVSRTLEDDVSRENYEVGYGRPPKWSQFKKGERRNPPRRPIRSAPRTWPAQYYAFSNRMPRTRWCCRYCRPSDNRCGRRHPWRYAAPDG